jgi:hypothetical protein
MRTVDRIFGWLMVVAAILHCVGSYSVYHSQHDVLLWAYCSGLAELYLAAMNLMRAERRHDLVLARVCVAGNIAWLGVVFAFAMLIGHLLDVRVLIQVGITVVLLWMSARSRRRSRPM